MKIKLDPRIRGLLELSVSSNHRSLFLIVGDRAASQVATLHYMLVKAAPGRPPPSLLWCYKTELGFSPHQTRAIRATKKRAARGLLGAGLAGKGGGVAAAATAGGVAAPTFELFVASASIRYARYVDADTLLGATYGLVVLQDFEGLTPNLLARTAEMAAGGGAVVLLVKAMPSLRALYALTLDAHARLATPAHRGVVPRWNRRFVLSLASCRAALVVDDELNVLPLFSHNREGAGDAAVDAAVATIRDTADGSDDDDGSNGNGVGAEGRTGAMSSAAPPPSTAATAELSAIKASLVDTPGIGVAVGMTVTPDQARAVLTLADVAQAGGPSTVALTAARGRGKSVSLGLAIAVALHEGYKDILLTAPSVENVGSVFAFVVAAAAAFGWAEHLDYAVIRERGGGRGAVGAEGGEAGGAAAASARGPIVRVDVHARAASGGGGGGGGDGDGEGAPPSARRIASVRYVTPADAATAAGSYGGGGVELLVVDEAAAIPLPTVRSMLGPFPVWLASTVAGYEGTGRSLSLKLLEQLRVAAATGAGTPNAPGRGLGPRRPGGAAPPTSSRPFRHVKLVAPVRYAPDDAVEAWLDRLLLLSAGADDGSPAATLPAGYAPDPAACQLLALNRDTLFSGHAAAEAFLSTTMGLFISSHYKNAPSDLLLAADAPAHRLFVLLGPDPPAGSAAAAAGTLPDVLAAVQVCLEGGISRAAAAAALGRGERGAGDLIPWTVSQQFGEPGFASLPGARIVRLAVHPRVQGMGYGSRAVALLIAWYAGGGASPRVEATAAAARGGAGGGGEEKGGEAGGEPPLPPLLCRLSERRPEPLVYLGVSFGLTSRLHAFWARAAFVPVYIRPATNDTTGEHTCIMLRTLGQEGAAADGDDDAATPVAAPPPAASAAADTAPPTVRTDGAAGPAASTSWLPALHRDWRRRLAVLLGRELAGIPPALALALLADAGGASHPVPRPTAAAGFATATVGISAHDAARLDAYVRRAVDLAVVADLLPAVATAGLVAGGVPVTDAASPAAAGGSGGDGASPPQALLPLSLAQAAVLAAVGLQRKFIDTVAEELGLPGGQVLALLHKAVRKVAAAVRSGREAAAAAALGASPPPLVTSTTPTGGGGRGGVGHAPTPAVAPADVDSDSDADGNGADGGSNSDGDATSLVPSLRQYAVPAVDVGGRGGDPTAVAVGSVVSGSVKRRRIGGGGTDKPSLADAPPVRAGKKAGGGKRHKVGGGGGQTRGQAKGLRAGREEADGE
ncbi:hypothetical protein MMPV_007792 [Pyropia vietnamensis]